jgi:hypothetical protein
LNDHSLGVGTKGGANAVYLRFGLSRRRIDNLEPQRPARGGNFVPIATFAAVGGGWEGVGTSILLVVYAAGAATSLALCYEEHARHRRIGAPRMVLRKRLWEPPRRLGHDLLDGSLPELLQDQGTAKYFPKPVSRGARVLSKSENCENILTQRSRSQLQRRCLTPQAQIRSSASRS